MGKAKQEQLEELLEFHQQSVNYERSQARYSLAIFGGGAVLLGVGVISVASGMPEGAVALLPGGIMTWFGQNSLRSDMNDAMEMQGKVAVTQYKLEEFENS